MIKKTEKKYPNTITTTPSSTTRSTPALFHNNQFLHFLGVFYFKLLIGVYVFLEDTFHLFLRLLSVSCVMCVCLGFFIL
ncbi:hypothetical protein BWD121_010630 [Bartonella sp. WD12.1]|nr:hypothetical protein BWD121_010630 [Bartonella sp. WD12.1]